MTDEPTLRERCIEAGGYSFPSDWLVDDYHIAIGEAAFDAILGVLTEHADEWTRNRWPNATSEFIVHAEWIAGELPTVLREQAVSDD